MSTSVQLDHSYYDHEDSPPCMDFGQSDLDSDTENTDNTGPSPVLTYKDEFNELSGTVNPFKVVPRQFVHCIEWCYRIVTTSKHILRFCTCTFTASFLSINVKWRCFRFHVWGWYNISSYSVKKWGICTVICIYVWVAKCVNRWLSDNSCFCFILDSASEPEEEWLSDSPDLDPGLPRNCDSESEPEADTLVVPNEVSSKLSIFGEVVNHLPI